MIKLRNILNESGYFLDKFKGSRSTSIISVEFETGDIQREEVIKEVLDIYGGVVPPEYHNYIDPDEPLLINDVNTDYE